MPAQNIKGTVYQIRDDEIVLPDDPRGEMKIDSYGNLLGGSSPSTQTHLLFEANISFDRPTVESAHLYLTLAAESEQSLHPLHRRRPCRRFPRLALLLPPQPDHPQAHVQSAGEGQAN